MKKYLLQILEALSVFLNKITLKISSSRNSVTITSLNYNPHGRFLTYNMSNNNLQSKPKYVLRGIFTSLMENERFLNFGKQKIIIITAIINGEEFSYHHNILINNFTPFLTYYNKVKDAIQTNYENGYPVEVITRFRVKVWNMDEIANKKIKVTINATNSYGKGLRTTTITNRMFSTYIRPIKLHTVDPTCETLSTMDIETIDVKGTQLPIAISVAYCDIKQSVKTKLFLINHKLFLKNPSTAVTLLWKEYFEFITFNPQLFKTIFVHNLGSFDGLFLYKALSNRYTTINKVTTIIDDQNKFIQITLKVGKHKIVWKDSYRLFSVSLNDLCTVFNVPGKISKYDPRFNDISIFNKANSELLKLFKEYSIQDALSLYQALDKAQEIYSRDFSVDIAKSLSSSSLSLKIFRTLFLKTDIPILKGTEDSFIRKGYFGGATDYYKAYAKKLFYYDVNSLYPYAMLKPMPHKMIKFYNSMTNIKLDDFFGFCLAEVTTPKNTLRPLLPHKYKGKTIFPTGTWIGIYFSEELKAVADRGYTIKLIKGYEFSKIDLFTSYVNHFYELKKYAKGAQRWIAKMHLNQLYGIFGRRKDLIETFTIRNTEIPVFVSTRIVKSIININDRISTVLVQNNINSDLIDELNVLFETNISNSLSDVKSNVAIAAAVTAYARIHMIPFRLHPGTVYTDTDSIFTTIELSLHLLGLDLGLMKDEMKGSIINEGYFLGIKQYGYWYNDSDNKRIEKSVFAGITRDSISFAEIVKLFEGLSITKTIPNRFYRSFKNLSISIKNDVKVNVKMNNDKMLVDNNYIPINIIELDHNLDNRPYFFKLKNRFSKYINFYFNK